MNIVQKIAKLAQILEEQGKPDAPIKVKSSRNYLAQCGLKPDKRGAALFFRNHQIITLKRNKNAPEQTEAF